jgi:hypothetical protein
MIKYSYTNERANPAPHAVNSTEPEQITADTPRAGWFR